MGFFTFDLIEAMVKDRLSVCAVYFVLLLSVCTMAGSFTSC